ncbi:MAG TPA: hypothetical protein VHO47_04040 [Candidatus Babeliales bacterium]|nr:hypothetical protein [Candidatus Babeliales bacterium]
MLGTETYSPNLKHHIKEYATVDTRAVTVRVPLYATLYHMGRLKK